MADSEFTKLQGAAGADQQLHLIIDEAPSINPNEPNPVTLGTSGSAPTAGKDHVLTPLDHIPAPASMKIALAALAIDWKTTTVMKLPTTKEGISFKYNGVEQKACRRSEGFRTCAEGT